MAMPGKPWVFLISFISSSPVPSGNPMSLISRSKTSEAASSRAEARSAAVRTACRCWARAQARYRKVSVLSSTSSILNGRGPEVRAEGRRRRGGLGDRSGPRRQLEGEGGPSVLAVAGGGQATAVRLGHRPADRQAQAQSAEPPSDRGVTLFEDPEDPRKGRRSRCRCRCRRPPRSGTDRSLRDRAPAHCAFGSRSLRRQGRTSPRY